MVRQILALNNNKDLQTRVEEEGADRAIYIDNNTRGTSNVDGTGYEQKGGATPIAFYRVCNVCSVFRS